jgi:hypothetical protein
VKELSSSDITEDQLEKTKIRISKDDGSEIELNNLPMEQILLDGTNSSQLSTDFPRTSRCQA